MQNKVVSTKRIILFDGVCNMCNGLVRFTIKRDRRARINFASMQSTRGQALLEGIGLPTDDLNSFVFIEGDRYYLRSTAALKVLKELGGVWKIFYVLTVIPRFIRDYVYRFIAKRRYKIFGRRATCMIPSPDLKSRFLDEDPVVL
ncbi:MAG: thiol-disulfide oxidoreductase DCC family protein [Chitinophagaceae bacterium]